MKQRYSGRAALDDIELEYEICGTGDPVVLIHPGHFADWLALLLDEAALTDRYCVLSYHRVGCAGSSHIAGPVSLAQHAAHCVSLMHELDIERAHVVGHSSGANVALQLALDAPSAVHSLAVLEPALYSVPSAATSRAFVSTAIERFRAGDKVGAIDAFLQGVCGSGYRAVLDRSLPGAFDQHVADAATFFTQELPALREWSFAFDDARRITQATLAVMGQKSAELDRIWVERQELLLAWLPNVESFVLRNAGHLLSVENPCGMAEGLAAFFARHRLSEWSRPGAGVCTNHQ